MSLPLLAELAVFQGPALQLAYPDQPDLREVAVSWKRSQCLVERAAARPAAGRATADGTVGLAREFLRAGARAVVASYWKVSDQATRILVNRFYDRFLEGAKSQRGGNGRVDVAAALRDAMLATRDDLSRQTGAGQGASAHPGGWGPFFVLGDGGLRDEL